MTETKPENQPGLRKTNPSQPGQPQPAQPSNQSGSDEPTQLGSNLKLAPESVKTDKGQITSAATLQEDRRPGVQYPASSNQLPTDFEAQDQETPQQRADRETAEAVAQLDEDNADLLAAASSGDAGVHELLARRSVAAQNLDEAGVKAVDAKLKELFSV